MTNTIQKLKNLPRTVVAFNIVCCLLALALIQGFTFTKISQVIEHRFFHPLLFNTREYFKESTLDPRIKIFSYDDRTAAYLKSLDIPLDLWGRVIRQIGKEGKNPILIDKLFDVPYTQTEIQSFQEFNVKSAHTIAFSYKEAIPYRSEISDEILAANQQRIFTATNNPSRLTLPRVFAYAAPNDLLKQFGSFGHAEYHGDNRVAPWIRLTQDHVIPHAFLSALDSATIQNNQLLIGNKEVPLSKDQKILVNFSPKSVYLKRALSFLAVIERTKTNQPISVIKPGDFVVILPAMYTGNTDFRETPFGPMAGGYHLVALLNSALTGHWIAEYHDPGFLAFVIGLISFLFCIRVRVPYGLAFCGLASSFLITLSLGLFIGMNISFSMILPIAACVVASAFGMSLSSRILQSDELRIQRELDVAIMVQDTFFPRDLGAKNSKRATQISGRFQPASECGGDWYGSFTSNGHTYIFMGDAVGHGLPAALVTAVAFSVTKTLEQELNNAPGKSFLPTEIMLRIDKILKSMLSNMACMTFLALRINEQTGECVYANAGNQQPLLMPLNPSDPRLKNSRVIQISSRGDILGAIDNPQFSNNQMTLMPSDKIILFSDGLVENISKKTLKPIGSRWLRQTLSRIADEETKVPIINRIWYEYHLAIGKDPPLDDTTITVIEFKPS
jgi:serine phosphatase RsbU (regulator of sigma subunit)